MTDLDDDFADLNVIIAEDEQRRAAKRHAAGSKARLAKGGLDDSERIALERELDEWVTKHTWQVVANIALFHTQTCASCGSLHRFFMGWFTQQDHRTDKNARRFVAGKSHEPLPERIEHHAQGSVEMCGNCAESCLIINQYVKE